MCVVVVLILLGASFLFAPVRFEMSVCAIIRNNYVLLYQYFSIWGCFFWVFFFLISNLESCVFLFLYAGVQFHVC